MPYAALLLFQHAYDPGAPVHGAPWLWFTILKIIVVFTVIIMVRPTGIFGERTVNRA